MRWLRPALRLRKIGPMSEKVTPLLPFVPSQLIRLALADFALTLAMPDKYEVDMGTWHSPREYHDGQPPKCAICFAGSVIAMTLDMSIASYAHADFFPGNSNQLRALDSFRMGDIGDGLCHLGIADRRSAIDFGIFQGMRIRDRRSLNESWGGLPWCVTGIAHVYPSMPANVEPFIRDMKILADKLEGLGL